LQTLDFWNLDWYGDWGQVSPAGSYSALQLRSVGWVRIEGLDIQASKGHAIDAEGCHHIQIVGNKCHDSGGGGISVNTSDYVSIEANEVFRNTSTNPYQCSGISLYQARAYDSEPGFHIYVRRNLVYSNVETSTGLSETSEGNGIILDDFQNLQSSPGNVAAGSYNAETLIENNIIGFNGGAGIVVFQSNYAVVRHNSVALNNTDKKNLQTFRGELASTKSHHVRWYNNFAACDRTSNPHSHAMLDVVGEAFVNEGNEWKGNLFFDPSTPSSTPILVWGPGNTLSTAVIEANNLLRRNPLFVRNFDLSNVNYFAGTVNSPMTNGALPSYASATDYFGRARVNTPDIGAIETF
jgi:parallel beta-helix repeat protein